MNLQNVYSLEPNWRGDHRYSGISWEGKVKARARKALAVWLASLAWTVAAIAQPRAIDTAQSVMTVRVYKAGLLSALGHNHEIAAPIAGGTVDTTARQIELHTHARALQVRDPGVSDKDRTEIQSTMLGPEVLDAERHPEIVFRATAAEPLSAGSWKVQGNLTLHGQTRAVAIEVREEAGITWGPHVSRRRSSASSQSKLPEARYR